MHYLAAFRFGAVFLMALFAAPALAAEPIEIRQYQGRITVGVDEVKVFNFGDIITRIELTRGGVAQAIPRSQTELTLTGLASGQTPILVFGEGGKRLYSGTVTVTPEPGHLVRIFRLPSREEKSSAAKGDGKTDNSDDYWCTDARCTDMAVKKLRPSE